ncbi:A disintegrin and metalloproteinase with thrombospondin motifs 16-like [Montipora capricornis]|uniref:A disintegrin and metalloproteinase with thrombospondin motifs 16-like n=1 Tax=Montipora capricornis TaxID=246305 RepID=UPI0035F1C1F4
MRLILLFLAFFFSFNEVIDSTRPDLHLILSSDELRKYLDTDSNDAVPDYDLTQVIHYKGKRSINSPQKNFFLSAFGKHMELKLKHNSDVIANDGLTVERKTSEGLLSKEIHFPKEEFYVGHVTSDSGSHVALRETERKGQLRGAILMDEHFYQLKPLTDDLHERASLNGSGYHVIYRRSVKSIARRRKKASPLTVPKKPLSILVQDETIQQDQDNVSVGPFFIEAMLTADKTTCDFYGNETLDYLLDTANLVSRLYKDPSIGVNVTWVLVKVFLVEGFDPLLDFTTNHVTSASQYLHKFRRWSSIRNTPNGAREHFDLAAFLSRRICGLGDCYLDGLAAYNVPCSDWGVSIDDARGLTAAFTLAHEMAHNLGVGHDSGKDCSGGFIMHSTQSSGPNAFRWSPCSSHRMKEIFRDNICFQNKPPHELPSPPLPPGYLSSSDKQGQMAQGPEFRACPLPALSVSCGPLYCITQGGGSCYSRGAPVAEGTVCGYRKWCRAGECSDVGSGFPAPQDGGWSSWGTYGGCSRTCGGGVKYRSRKCNNPQPKYFGKGCKGSSKGHYMMCNTQDCAVENFRQKQCEEHNTKSKKYSAHLPGGVRNCRLACASGSKWYYFGDVKDGTRCGKNQYEYDVCIGGICKNVGCDKNWALQRFMIDVYIAEGMVARVSYQRILIGRTIAPTGQYLLSKQATRISYPVPPLPPVYLTSRDKQCQMAQGPEFRACPLQALSVSCGPLYCITQGGGSCYSRGAPVAEGTVCGYRKWCRAGECSDVGSGFPAPQDGGWSSWGTYGGCSRTCGGGVKYRSRKCNNPQPKYFGKGCKGSSKGHYMMCNTQDCAVENFRQKQCEEHNTKSKKYSAHLPGGVRNCRLACASGSKWYYFGDVKDGTRCGKNQYEYDVCIGGICKNVGCDKKLGSAKVYDRCLHCGGNGSSCILSEDTYRKDYRTYGQYNGDTMVIIPQGATNVWIHELGNTINFLSIASNQTGKYYVPVPSWTGTHYAAGTEIYHSMKSYHDAEEIYIRGPTNEALQAKFVYSGRQRNPGVYYIFYSPGIGNGTKFVWRQELKESCSATCAGGIQTIRITCNREDDGSQVSLDYCDISTKPAESIPCNLAPCPKQFEDGVWSVCSTKCGGGLQYRNLTCVQVVSKDSTLVLPNSECSHLSKPKTMQECNQVDCLPDWVTGNWTRCSDVCGGGTKSRSVECKKKLRNGELVTLAHADCEGINTEKPVSVMQCISKPCSEWKVQYPCVTCGGLNNMSYVPVGCFRDRNTGVRPLPELLSSYRYHIDWNRVNLMVEKCAQDAWAKQFPVFGVQYYAECWSGPSGYLTYDKDGPNLDGCWQGVGKGWNNYVYAFTNLVVEPVVDCIDTVTNQTITEDLCSSPKPHVRMKLCSQVCSAR